MSKFDKVSARLSFSPKYRRAVAEKCYKTFNFHEQRSYEYIFGVYKCPNFSIFLGLVYLWGLKFPKCSIFLGFSKIDCV